MKQITFENYRCFHQKQDVPLAPLTLLVGNNSTGKTSFLAMIRILWDSVYGYGNLNFKESPFDLGSFDQIAFRHNGRGNPVSAFEAGFYSSQDFSASLEFKEYQTLPVRSNMRLGNDDSWVEYFVENGVVRMKLGTHRGTWLAPIDRNTQNHQIPMVPMRQLFLHGIHSALYKQQVDKLTKFAPLYGSPSFSNKDTNSVLDANFMDLKFSEERPFMSAPIQSKPQRTYDQGSWIPDTEGCYAPMFLSSLENFEKEKWQHLKSELERFGSSAGLFDEINIKRFGKSASAPFQVQVRKFGKKRKGPKHNLIDVGYGVSQVLPILTELLLPENTRMALLQQPEIHLHPSAQAALGSFFCEIASRGRQLVVETHSDFLVDRIRMDIRDQKTNLKPEDVSILFFEHNDIGVQIHPIQIDGLGNVLNTPNSYGAFFMDEISRSLWIGDYGCKS